MVLAGACGDDPQLAHQATLRTTSYGISHISAEGLEGLGFGQGYVVARDHGCTLAEQIIKVRGERARYLGPGERDRHLDSDFGYRALHVYDQARVGFAALSADAQALYRGFAAGYNHFLAGSRAALPCADVGWLVPIDALDLLAFSLDLTRLGAGAAYASQIGAAVRPSAAQAPVDNVAALLPPGLTGSLASNGWALGAERSESGRGALLASPHLPWEGERRLHEVHLTVTGAGGFDVYGAGYLGVPLVQLGFNASLAWTFTASSAARFTLYRLALRGDDSYLTDGVARALTAETFEVEVRRDAGLSPERRTLHRSHHGPIVRWDLAAGRAYALRDATDDDPLLLDQLLGLARSARTAELLTSLSRLQALPFMAVLAADREGNTLFVDAAQVPNLSDEALRAYQLARGQDAETIALSRAGVVLLDGSTSRDEWARAADLARQPGLIPLSHAPQQTRRDFLFHANQAPWLQNPAQPLGGFSPLYGLDRGPLSPRARMNAVLLTETGPNAAGGPEGKWSLEELTRAALGNRGLMAEVLLRDLLPRCLAARLKGPIDYEEGGQPRREDIAQACQALALWDGRAELDAPGAVVFREWLAAMLSAGASLTGVSATSSLFQTAFDPQKPVETPKGLPPAPAQGADPALVALARASALLRGRGLDPGAATLAQLQFTCRGLPCQGTTRLSLHGGQEAEGTLHTVSYDPEGGASSVLPRLMKGYQPTLGTALWDAGYPVNRGSSLVLAVAFEAEGPRAQALLSYGQVDLWQAAGGTGSPGGDGGLDAARLFAAKRYREVLFRAAQIAADPALETLELP